MLHLKPSVLFVIALLLPCAAASAQYIVDKRPLGVVKDEGWKIPYLAELKAGKRLEQMKIDATSQSTLYATQLDVDGDGVVLADAGYYIDDGRKGRKFHAAPIVVSSFTRYDVGGKVFCYVTYGTGVGITKRTHKSTSVVFLGCEMGYAYYDLDGDGKFETLSVSGRSLASALYIPAWVRERKQNVFCIERAI